MVICGCDLSTGTSSILGQLGLGNLGNAWPSIQGVQVIQRIRKETTSWPPKYRALYTGIQRIQGIQGIRRIQRETNFFYRKSDTFLGHIQSIQGIRRIRDFFSENQTLFRRVYKVLKVNRGYKGNNRDSFHQIQGLVYRNTR